MTHYTVKSVGKWNRPQGELDEGVPKARLSDEVSADFVVVASFDNASKGANLD